MVHTFEPIYDDKSEILILGSLPSVKSRENQFYYGHPQNRFWKVIAGMFGEQAPVTIEEKKKFLLRHHIAVWDVIASCDIIGSADSTIKNVVANDMDIILQKANIKGIFANGDKAYQLFLKYCGRESKSSLKFEQLQKGRPPVYKLPSTSPANAAWNLEKLIAAWGEAVGSYLIEWRGFI